MRILVKINIKMSEVNNEVFEKIIDSDSKKETIQLLKQANSILNAFKNRFWEKSDQYSKALKEYSDLEKIIIKSKNDIKDQAKSETKELQNFIDEQELVEIRNEFNQVQTLFISDIKLSINSINFTNVETIENNKLEALFNYFMTNDIASNEISFITNENFIRRFLNYILIKNSNKIDDFIIKLNPKLTSQFRFLDNLIDDGLPIWLDLYFSSLVSTKNQNNSLDEISMASWLFIDNYIKNWWDKVAIYRIFFQMLSSYNAVSIFESFLNPLNKKEREELFFSLPYTSKNLIPTIYKYYKEPDEKEVIDINVNALNIIKNNENEWISLCEKILNNKLDEKEKTESIKYLNSYIELVWIEKIWYKLIEIIKQWNLEKLTSIHYSIENIKKIINLSNQEDKYLIKTSLLYYAWNNIKSDESFINSFIWEKTKENNELWFIDYAKPDTIEKLNKFYIDLKNKGFSSSEIFLNPKFSTYIDFFLEEKKLINWKWIWKLEVEKEYFENKNFIWDYLSKLNLLTLKNNKENILKIIEKNWITDKETFYQLFLEWLSSLNNWKIVYPKMLQLAWKGWEDRIKKIYNEVLEQQKLYLSNTHWQIKSDINSLLNWLNIEWLIKEKPKIKEFFIWKELDLYKVLNDFENFEKKYPKKPNETDALYQWRIRNEYVENLWFWTSLNDEEWILKEIFLNISKIKFLKKEVKQKIATTDTYFKYLSWEIKQEEYFKKVDEYKKEQELKENTNLSNQSNNLNQAQDNYLIPEITKTESWYNFTTTTTSWNKLDLPITPYEAALINWSEKIKENFKKFSETLSELNILNIWKHREWIFKAIAEKNWISFNVNDDFLKETEVKLFLTSLMKSVWKEFNNEEKNWNIESIKTKIKSLNNNNDLIKWEKNTNAKWESKIEELFRQNFIENDWTFQQDKFKQYI